MSIFLTIAERIIKEQELVIGPLAWEEAAKVPGLQVNGSKKEVAFSAKSSEDEAVNKLVKQYERLFGRASVEVCKDAVKEIVYEMPKDQVPSLLR